MRVRLLELWPVLSAVHGLHPWDIEHLTPGEVLMYEADARARVTRAASGPPSPPQGPSRRRPDRSL